MSLKVMRIWKGVGKSVFAALFILGGIGHFLATDIYMKIMPPYLPYHRALVLLSGVFEVALGLLLLVPATSRLAAWGLIALLVAVFPANVYMFQNPEKFDLSPTLLLLRLPLQGVLILWAFAYARRPVKQSDGEGRSVKWTPFRARGGS
jgi:uncharacterized membrane protein